MGLVLCQFLLFYCDVVAMPTFAVYNYFRYTGPSIKDPSDLVAEWLTRLLFRTLLTRIGKQKVPRSIRGQVTIVGVVFSPFLSHSYLPPFAV